MQTCEKYTYKKDNLKTLIQTSTNQTCNYSKNISGRLLECYMLVFSSLKTKEKLHIHAQTHTHTKSLKAK